MRGGRPRGAGPFGARPFIGAAIDDESLAAVAHLERQRAGVRRAVEPGGGKRTRVEEDERLAGGKALEAGMRRARRRLALRLGARQDEVEGRSEPLRGAVELGEPPVAVAEEAEERRHPVDRRL